jgi:polyketide biosynthesis 3-hydroxy-3-methylglutaryl-CoA synthase-like enzyme PksG
MIAVGIEAMNLYGGIAQLDLKLLAEARNLDPERFAKLLMHAKTIAMPYEDAVSCAVNAAQPLVAALSDQAKSQIELLITCTESGIDLGKSLSPYVHDYLRLNRNCRLFEVKHMCYGGTAGLQMAVNFVLSQTSPGAKALVIATDLTHLTPRKGETADLSYAEPSFGAGAVALLVSDQPHLLQLDIGCNGYYGYEVMDAGRPVPDVEWGDVDLSLLSYLDCCEQSYRHYQSRVEGVDYQDSFGYLAFHTPFGGMVKGAHQMMMRKFKTNRPEVIEDDFQKRVAPSLRYCQQIGNVMSATVFMALAGAIDYGQLPAPQRVGLFSYGGGCSSEFFSGVISAQSQARLAERKIADHLARRYPLTFAQYEQILYNEHKVAFGTRNIEVDTSLVPEVWQQIQGRGLLMLRRIQEFHREYGWV